MFVTAFVARRLSFDSCAPRLSFFSRMATVLFFRCLESNPIARQCHKHSRTHARERAVCVLSSSVLLSFPVHVLSTVHCTVQLSPSPDPNPLRTHAYSAAFRPTWCSMWHKYQRTLSLLLNRKAHLHIAAHRLASFPRLLRLQFCSRQKRK